MLLCSNLAGDMLPAPEARVGLLGHRGQCNSPAQCFKLSDRNGSPVRSRVPVLCR